MPFEPDRFLLRRYHAAMARGDLPAAAEAWDQLAVQNFDRINQTVKLFRFSAASGKGIPVVDQGSAVSEAFLRVRAMGAHFRKQEIEAYYAALVHCVQNSCRDFGRYSGALAAWEAARHEQAAERIRSELEQQRDEGLMLWAIGQIKNDKYREVLKLTYNEKLPTDEIAERLEISTENAYQRRSRGLRELKKILDEHNA